MGSTPAVRGSSVDVDDATRSKCLQKPADTGFTGGVQVGYNWQSGMWVYGLGPT